MARVDFAVDDATTQDETFAKIVEKFSEKKILMKYLMKCVFAEGVISRDYFVIRVMQRSFQEWDRSKMD